MDSGGLSVRPLAQSPHARTLSLRHFTQASKPGTEGKWIPPQTPKVYDFQGRSRSHNKIVLGGMAPVCAVTGLGNSFAALRSVRRPVFRRIVITTPRRRSSGSRHARRLQRHVLMLFVPGYSRGRPWPGSGESGNRRYLDRSVFARSGAAPGNTPPSPHRHLRLVRFLVP
jgi:hypothetical protein